MYTRPSLQKTQEFRPIPGRHQPKLAAWSSVLLDRRSGCEHLPCIFFSFFLCSCSSPAVVEASTEKIKMKKKKTDLPMLCSHHFFLHDRCCPLLVTACTNCHFLLLLHEISSPVIADSVYVVKMTLNFLFKNLNVIPFLLCPPSPLFLTA